MSDYSDYAYQQYVHNEKPFGSFVCKGCYVDFSKASPEHGSSGYCCQCEIARGLFKIHGDDEQKNADEQRRTKVMLAQFVAATVPFRNL